MFRTLLLLSLLLAAPAGASPPPNPQPAPAAGAPVVGTAPAIAVPPGDDSIRRVTVAELQQAQKAGKVVVVDVRSKDDYAASHAKGALSIPLNEIEQRSKELPKESLIVTYCT